jgi:hypothetical protein
LTRISAHLFGEDVVIGKTRTENRSAHPLALEIDLGNQIDRAFLVDVESRFAARQLDSSGVENDLDRCGEEDGIWWDLS